MKSKKRLIDTNALKNTLDNLEAQGGHKYYRAGTIREVQKPKGRPFGRNLHKERN